MAQTDRGTENTLMAAMQCSLHRSHGDDHASLKAHVYGPSTSSQRIEAWWSHLHKSWTTWWMNFLSQIVERGELNTSDDLQKNCLWFCFNKLLQQGLDQEYSLHKTIAVQYASWCSRPDVFFTGIC